MVEKVVHHVHGLINDDLNAEFDMLLLQVLEDAL